MSNSWQLHGLYSPWNSLGQNTGVDNCPLLQGTFPNPGIELRSPALQLGSLPAVLLLTYQPRLNEYLTNLHLYNIVAILMKTNKNFSYGYFLFHSVLMVCELLLGRTLSFRNLQKILNHWIDGFQSIVPQSALWVSNINFTWDLVGGAESQTPPRPTQAESVFKKISLSDS